MCFPMWMHVWLFWHQESKQPERNLAYRPLSIGALFSPWPPTQGFCSTFNPFVNQVLSLSPAPGCQSPPLSLFSLSDRFYLHKSWVLGALCFSRGLLLRIKARLTPVVPWHCSEWIAMCSWCLNCLNASPGHHFNGFSLGWYTLIRSIY